MKIQPITPLQLIDRIQAQIRQDRRRQQLRLFTISIGLTRLARFLGAISNRRK